MNRREPFVFPKGFVSKRKKTALRSQIKALREHLDKDKSNEHRRVYIVEVDDEKM